MEGFEKLASELAHRGGDRSLAEKREAEANGGMVAGGEYGGAGEGFENFGGRGGGGGGGGDREGYENFGGRRGGDGYGQGEQYGNFGGGRGGDDFGGSFGGGGASLFPCLARRFSTGDVAC